MNWSRSESEILRSSASREYRTNLSEWQPEQYAMKFRAPRCSEGRFEISLSAARCQPAWPPSLAEAAPAPNASARPTTFTNLMSFISHSIGNRSIAVSLGDERKQDEEREVQHREDAGQQHVDAVGGLEAQPHEHEERDEEHRQQHLRCQAAITNRLVLRAVEPRNEQEGCDRQRHQQRAELLIRDRAQDRVVRSEVPNGRDVFGRGGRVRRLEVRGFHEQTAERRDEEHDDGEQRQEQADTDDVLERVVRMKRNAVFRLAIGAEVFL